MLNLLGYDGKVCVLTSGYWLKFEVRRVAQSKAIPHGLAYAFTLHEPEGMRILGFDNAHPVPHAGSAFIAPPVAADHWHRDEGDAGRPYQFVDADTLVVEFFNAVQAKLSALGLPFDVQAE